MLTQVIFFEIKDKKNDKSWNVGALINTNLARLYKADSILDFVPGTGKKMLLKMHINNAYQYYD